MSNNNVTIQINSLQALERLIGGDTELEVSLRQSVAVEMGKRHLKEVTNSPYIQSLIREAQKSIEDFTKQEIEKQVGTVKGTGTWNSPKTITFLPDIINQIRDYARRQVDEIIKEETKKLVDQLNIGVIVQQHVNTLVIQELKEQFNQKMAAALLK